MKLLYTCNVATGKYTNHEGQEKTSWLKIGAILQKEDGNAVLKLDAVPVGVKDWEGWVQLFKPQDRQGQGNQQKVQQGGSQEGTEGFNDTITPAMGGAVPF